MTVLCDLWVLETVCVGGGRSGDLSVDADAIVASDREQCRLYRRKSRFREVLKICHIPFCDMRHCSRMNAIILVLALKMPRIILRWARHW